LKLIIPIQLLKKTKNGVFGFSMVHYRRVANHYETMWGGVAGGKTCNLLKNKQVRQPAKPWTPVF
jgi:hypothetical protein